MMFWPVSILTFVTIFQSSQNNSEVPTFLVAGHETTATATTWALFSLTQCPEAQAKLRNQLLAVGTDNPTMDELNALPYLDAVVRETLRIHPPVASTMRVATKDDILPLSEPVKDRNGNILDSIMYVDLTLDAWLFYF